MVAAPAQAEVDSGFSNELQIYGIYGQKDYNSWIGKITCNRLSKGLDKDANMSAQTGARNRIYWFFSLDYAGRRQYSQNTATNVYYEFMATRWGNGAKLFFNNKGVVAHATEVCMNYPPSDPSVWNW